MPRYRLTNKADADLAGILEWGIDNHGEAKAIDYHATLTRRFEHISEQPYQYTAVDDIKEGFRRTVCGVHSVYYRIDPDEIVIVRVLRGQDLKTSL